MLCHEAGENTTESNTAGYQYAVVIQDVYDIVHCLVVQAAVADGRGIWNRPLSNG